MTCCVCGWTGEPAYVHGPVEVCGKCGMPNIAGRVLTAAEVSELSEQDRQQLRQAAAHATGWGK